MNEQFKYDVFISHNTKDKPVVVRALAERLRKDGLRVWPDGGIKSRAIQSRSRSNRAWSIADAGSGDVGAGLGV